jgi:hypothetical protein
MSRSYIKALTRRSNSGVALAGDETAQEKVGAKERVASAIDDQWDSDQCNMEGFTDDENPDMDYDSEASYSSDEDSTLRSYSPPVDKDGNRIDKNVVEAIRTRLREVTDARVAVTTNDIERFAVAMDFDDTIDVFALIGEAHDIYSKLIGVNTPVCLSSLALVFYWKIVWNMLIQGEVDPNCLCSAKKMLVSACQGGKTWALIMDGLLRIFARGDKVLFFGVSTADMYTHMQSGFIDILDRFKPLLDLLPDHIAIGRDELCECVRLNDPPKSNRKRVFRLRVGAVANVRSLTNKLNVPVNGSGYHFIVDESHLTEGDALYHQAIRKRFKRAVSGTYVTATSAPNLCMELCGGDECTTMAVTPRGGFYVDHHQYSANDGIFPMEVEEVTPKEATALHSLEANGMKPPLEAFKRAKGAMGVKPEWWVHLAERQERSCLHLVINNVLAHGGRGNSINAGHIEMARWMAQTHIKHNKNNSGRATVVSFAIYKTTNAVSADYRTPRLFFGSQFQGYMVKKRTRKVIMEAMDGLFTTEPTEANTKILLPQRLIAAGGVAALKNKLKECIKKGIKKEGRGCYSMQIPFPFSPKAVLGFIKEVSSSDKFEDGKYKFQIRPLQIFAVGEGLIRQSVNIESKDREIQTTKLTFISKPSVRAQIGIAELIQQVCRINGGYRDQSQWARSRLPSLFDWSTWKQSRDTIRRVSPIFYAEKRVIDIVSENSRYAHVMKGPEDIEAMGALTAAEPSHHISKHKRVKRKTDEAFHDGGEKTLLKRRAIEKSSDVANETLEGFIDAFLLFETSLAKSTLDKHVRILRKLYAVVGLGVKEMKEAITTNRTCSLVVRLGMVNSGCHVTHAIDHLKKFCMSR